MGRRALPRIDPNVYLGDHYTEFGDEFPDQHHLAMLPGDGPIEIEVGSGKGLFLTNAALAFPEHRFIGIEIARKYAKYAAFQLAKAGLENAIMLQGDGARFIREQIPKHSIRAVHVYFPDPWWKSRHRKRRIMNPEFLGQVIRILEPAGELHFWTDVEEYFHNALKLIATFPELVGPQPVDEANPEHDFDYRTHFERRMRRHDKPIYRSLFISRTAADSASDDDSK